MLHFIHGQFILLTNYCYLRNVPPVFLYSSFNGVFAVDLLNGRKVCNFFSEQYVLGRLFNEVKLNLAVKN